jgi:hypothetical protein
MTTHHKALLLSLSISFLLSAADPPADVDAALRSRVKDFYQLQVNGKYREAEQFVAADTKDFYYGSKKSLIKAFKIVEIQYAPDFLRAKVKLSSRMQLPLPGAIETPLEVPLTSDWKIDNGQWCWYVDQSKLRDTPFGRFNPGGASNQGALPNGLPKPPVEVSAASLRNGVSAEPPRLELDPSKSKPQIVILKNTLPGPVTIRSLNNSPALDVVMGKSNLGANESTEITITPVAGSSERPSQLLLKVEPIGETLRIGLDYAPAK